MSGHDLAWGRRTGGRLGVREEVGLLLAAAGMLLRDRRRPSPPARVPELHEPPASAFARRCLATAQDRSGRDLLGHLVRTWHWADIVAQLDGVDHDPELLWAACLLHDLGLVPQRPASLGPAGCFAVDGALEAHALAVEHGYPRADALADAVARHLDVTVPVALGPEAHLLHAGAGLDVLAVGLRRVPPASRAAVLGRHPRDGLKGTLVTLLGEEAVRRPRSRTGVMQRRLGFTDRVVAADALFCR